MHAAALSVGKHIHRELFHIESHAMKADDDVGVGIVAGEAVVGEDGKHLPAHALESGSRVRYLGTIDETNDEFEQENSNGFEDSRVIPVGPQKTGTDEHVTGTSGQLCEKMGDRVRVVLAVSIHLQEGLIPLFYGELVPCLQGDAVPHVEGVGDDVGACFAGDLGGAVAASVVDDHNIGIDDFFHAGDYLSDIALFVERGDDDAVFFHIDRLQELNGESKRHFSVGFLFIL